MLLHACFASSSALKLASHHLLLVLSPFRFLAASGWTFGRLSSIPLGRLSKRGEESDGGTANYDGAGKSECPTYIERY